MQFEWRIYRDEDAVIVDSWLDDYAIRKTGLDNGWQNFYNYWTKENPDDNAKDYCFIISESNEPFAIIFAAVIGAELIISEFIVAPKKRSKGSGTAIISELMENSSQLLGIEITSAQTVIYPSNIASQRAFEKAGFMLVSQSPDGDALNYKYAVKVKKMRAWLAGGGDFYAEGFKPNENDIIIAVDAGFARLEAMGINPHMVVGDFDSLEFVPNHPNIEQHPAVKDDTDTMLAVKKGIDAGCDEFYIFGATGGRLAHTLGNIQVLCYLAEHGKAGYIIDKKYVITAFCNSSLAFTTEHRGYISLLPWGAQEAAVTITGLKYELERAPLPCDKPLGISNEFTGNKAKITAFENTVVAVFENQNILPEKDEIN